MVRSYASAERLRLTRVQIIMYREHEMEEADQKIIWQGRPIPHGWSVTQILDSGRYLFLLDAHMRQLGTQTADGRRIIAKYKIRVDRIRPSDRTDELHCIDERPMGGDGGGGGEGPPAPPGPPPPPPPPPPPAAGGADGAAGGGDGAAAADAPLAIIV